MLSIVIPLLNEQAVFALLWPRIQSLPKAPEWGIHLRERRVYRSQRRDSQRLASRKPQRKVNRIDEKFRPSGSYQRWFGGMRLGSLFEEINYKSGELECLAEHQ
jgi:hypothetical protein